MSAEYSIETLFDSVSLIPPSLSLTRKIHTERYAAQSELVSRVEQSSRVNIPLIVGTCSKSMLRNERNLLVLVVDTRAGRSGVNVVVKLSTGETIAQTIVEVVCKCCSAKGSLKTTAVALSCVGHHSTESIVASHNRQLLVMNLHVESRQIEMNLTIEEVKMCTYLIVPARLRLELNGSCNTLIVSCIVFNVHVGTCLLSLS